MMVREAIKAGLLSPPEGLNCADCSAPAFCYDHRNYHKPFEVEPVCHGCNNRRGPGLPLIDKRIDGHRNKTLLIIKTGKSSGRSWSAINGDGENYSPLECQIAHTEEINSVLRYSSSYYCELYVHTNDRDVMTGNGNWLDRSRFFKLHDPWADEALIYGR